MFVEWWGDFGELGHRTIDLIHAFLEYVANQEIDDVHALFRILPQKSREAKAFVVKRVDQLAHRLNPAVEFRLVLAESRGGEVVMVESVVNGVRGEFRHLQRQQHAGRIDRIEKTVRVADENEPVARVLLGTI